MDSKSLRGVEIKNADKGQVTAIFSTFDVVDKDGDVTSPDAFTDGEQVSISAYNHTSWGGVLPVGKGTIRATKGGAVLEGQFFMDTQLGRETFQVVKNMGDQQEWSYGFDVVKHSFGEFEGKQVRYLEKLKVTEVSPVLLGAGENTRTVAVKSKKETKGEGPVEFKRAIRPHKSATTARPWDEHAVTDALGDDASVSELRSVYAWADGDPEAKASYRFPHHHGIDGPANIRALITGIAVLNGAKGKWNGPDEDREAIYTHLAQHLKDADREPPELRAPGGELTLHEEAIQALEGVKAYLESAKRVVALRAQKGKSLSQVNTEALDWVGEDLRGLLKEHSALMSTLQNTPRESAAEEFVRFLAMTRRAS